MSTMPEDMNIEQAELHGASEPLVSIFSRFSPNTQGYLREHFKEGTLNGHLASLTTAGFTKPVASIEKHPPLAGYDIQRVIGDLTAAGFTKPVALIEKFLPLAGLDIQRVIGDLTTVGFKTPVASIEKHPPLAGYDIQRVIGDLTAAGFTKPVALIEKFPQLAGYDIGRVKRRLRFISRLSKQFNLTYDPIGIIEHSPQYLGYSKDRLSFFLRLGSYYNIPENVYRSLTFLNPFLVFSELLAQPEGLEGIPWRIRKLSKSEKAQKISEVKEKLADIENTLESYIPQQRIFFLRLARNLKRQNESGKKKAQKVYDKTPQVSR